MCKHLGPVWVRRSKYSLLLLLLVGRASGRGSDSSVGRASGRGRDSSVGRASDWKARSNTDAGSSPRCGKGFFSRSQLPVQTLLRCPYSPRVQSHASTAVHTLKSQTLAVVPMFEHTKILYTLIGVGSAALIAAAMPNPGKSTRNSCKGQWSTKIKSRRNKGIYRKN